MTVPANSWPPQLAPKMAALQDDLRGLGSVLVAFSGGVDSAFLAAVAHDVLGDRAIAVTADSPSLPRRELEEAGLLAKRLGIRHLVIRTDELANPSYAVNPSDRCYHCKSELFGLLVQVAREEGLKAVLDGANADDSGDYRPGSRAAAEFGVRSPLRDAALSKQEIRDASAHLKLPTASKPASACLASRIPYGTEITAGKLQSIERAEMALHDLGFEQVRVRAHGDVARIELAPAEIARASEAKMRQAVAAQIRECGFRYVAIDLDGYRTGSLNDALRKS